MYIFIVNPLAGNGKSLTAWDEMKKVLRAQHIKHSVLHSTSIEETKTFIKNKFNHYTIKAVAIIGGDGTIHTVIQQLAGKNSPIAIYPTGSGNDTAKMFRLTTDVTKFINGLLGNRITSIDLLKVNGNYGITVAGVGLDAIIGNHVNQAFYKPILNKLGIGSSTYIIATVLSLLSFKPFNGHITIVV